MFIRASVSEICWLSRATSRLASSILILANVASYVRVDTHHHLSNERKASWMLFGFWVVRE